MPNIRVPETFDAFVDTITGKAEICKTEDCRDEHLNKGYFAKHIRKWLEFYNPSEILIINMNEPAESQAKKLLEFAGLPLSEYPWEKLKADNKKAFENKSYGGRESAWNEHHDNMCMLSKYYADSNKDLAKLLNEQFPLDWKSTSADTICK